MKNLYRITIALFAVSLISSIGFAQKTPRTAQNYYKLGTADLEADNYDNAIKFLSIAVGIKPDFAEAYFARSKARQYKNDISGALGDAEMAVKIEPRNGEAYFLRASLKSYALIDQLREGDPVAFEVITKRTKQILEDLDAAVKNGYKSTRVYAFRAEYRCHVLGNCDPAVDDYDQALRLEPGNAALQMRRSVAKYKAGDKQGALADYLKIVNRVEPDRYPSGRIYKTKREYYDSRDITDELDGAIQSNYSKSARRLMDEGKPEEVVAELSKAISLFPANYGLVDLRAHYGRFTRNKELVESDALRMIELKPFDFEVKSRSTHYLMGIGKCERSIEIMNPALVENPKNANAYLLRGNAKSCLEDFEGALADNDRAIELEPANETFKSNRANILARQNQTEKSLETYSEVINALELRLSIEKDENILDKIKRDLSYNYIARSRIYAKRDSVPEAFYDLDRAIQIRPDFYSHRIRARAYVWQKQFENAIRDYDEVIRLQPEDLGFYLERGDIYFQMGNYDAALSDFEKAGGLRGDIKAVVAQRIAATKAKITEKR